MNRHTKRIPYSTMGLLLGLLCTAVSCESLKKTVTAGSGGGSLPILLQNADTVGVEIYNIPVAPHQNELLQQLWRETDEQAFPLTLRRELLAQGFRAGVQGNMLSPALSRLLQVSSGKNTDAPSMNGFQEYTPADVMQESAVPRRQFRTLLPEMRAMIKIFEDAIPELPLFWNDGGMYCGQTYQEASGLIFVSAAAGKDGSAQFKIVPELEYGFHEQKMRSQAGIVIHETSRPRRTFESLTMNLRLLQGQWFIIGTASLESAGAGKAFFIRERSISEQRVLAIRFVKAAAESPPQTAPPPMLENSVPVLTERN